MAVKNKKGFTLLEILVAASLFVVVLSFGFSIYVSITRIQQRNFKQQKVLSESRFFLEFFSSEISSMQVDYSIPYPDNQIYLSDSQGEVLRYFLDTGDGRIKQQVDPAGAGVISSITSPEINITRLMFYVNPGSPDPDVIPTITVILRAQDLNAVSPTMVDLQTSVSMRNY
jgi:prepilin-type N-terminal cleavage/methylation domain-containing protein